MLEPCAMMPDRNRYIISCDIGILNQMSRIVNKKLIAKKDYFGIVSSAAHSSQATEEARKSSDLKGSFFLKNNKYIC
jgi:hypothetical protein